PNATMEIDNGITMLFGRELRKAKMMNSPSYYKDLRLIEDSMCQLERAFRSEYTKALAKHEEWNKNPENAGKPRPISINEELARIDQQYIQRFFETPPISEFSNELFKNASDEYSQTTIINLKASAIYTWSFKNGGPTKVCCWKLAFRALCNIKACSNQQEEMSALKTRTVYGGPRHLPEDIWKTQKLDKRWEQQPQQKVISKV
ncbi:1532_t:CDS:2, partial [Ambispora leptoticha]